MRKLTLEQIKAVTKGTVAIEEKDGKLCFLRFTNAQLEAYKPYSDDFYGKCFATAGVRMSFFTDSRKLCIVGECARSSSRNYFSFDVTVNGALIKTFRGTISDKKAEFGYEVDLGAGEKKVSVYFPWSVQTRIGSISIDDGAAVAPVERPYKMIEFGDSITHGYDAINPSFSYASRLADALCADAVNKGIGGEVFFPALAELKDVDEPDFITVAYGTNDWSKTHKDVFYKNSKLFYEKLSQSYPNAKIFALAPVWRGNYDTKLTSIGAFSNVAEHLKSIADALPNVIFIDCFDFIPHDEANYMPDVLHPNDLGFMHYANNLYAEIKKYL